MVPTESIDLDGLTETGFGCHRAEVHDGLWKVIIPDVLAEKVQGVRRQSFAS